MPSILVVGDAILDHYVSFTTLRESAEHVPIVAKCEWTHPGGACAVSEMCRALGVMTYDAFGDDRSRKVRTILDSKVLFREDYDVRTAPARLPALTNDIILVADYGKGAITTDVMQKLIQSGIPVIVDPRRGGSPDLYAGAWAIIPNLEEDRESGYFAAFPRAILKMGDAGMLVKDHGPNMFHLHAETRAPFDVCGAGDQVLATLGVCLSNGMSWRNSARQANRAAGINVMKRGTAPVTVSELWPSTSPNQGNEYPSSDSMTFDPRGGKGQRAGRRIPKPLGGKTLRYPPGTA